SRIITAREGRLLTDEVNRRITLRLLNGGVSEADVMPAGPPRSLSKDVTSGGAATGARYRYTLFGVYDLSLSVDSPLKGAPRGEKPEKDLTLAELTARVAELWADRHGRAPYLIELHKRFALPLAALVFALVAFPLAIRSHRGGRSVAFAGSLAILLTYYVVMTSLEGAALRLQIPTGIAIWTPNVLFALLGVGFLVATAREWRLPALPLFWRLLDALTDRASRRGARRGRLPGARVARPDGGGGGGGRLEIPRPGARPPPVPPSLLVPRFRRRFLPGRAPPPGNHRLFRRHDPRDGRRVSPPRPPRRPPRPLD